MSNGLRIGLCLFALLIVFALASAPGEAEAGLFARGAGSCAGNAGVGCSGVESSYSVHSAYSSGCSGVQSSYGCSGVESSSYGCSGAGRSRGLFRRGLFRR